jgi:hypothetical protein
LSFHVFVQAEAAWTTSLSGSAQNEIVCLTTLDLRDNEFTFHFIEEVQYAIIDLPLKTIDFRGNAGISADVVSWVSRRLRETETNTEIRTGGSKPVKPVKTRVSVKASARPPPLAATKTSKKSRDVRIQDLEKENGDLRRLISQLQSGENIVELEPGLEIVGPKATDFVEHIRKLEEMLPAQIGSPPQFLGQKSPKRGRRKQ